MSHYSTHGKVWNAYSVSKMTSYIPEYSTVKPPVGHRIKVGMMPGIECVKCGAKSQLYLCHQCQIWLRHQLLGMPTLIGHLRDTALGMTRLSSESTRQLGFESRTPTFNDRASDLIKQIETTIGQWARPLALTHGYVISPPIGINPIGYTHTSADYVTFLAAHVDQLAKDEYIGELCSSLRSCVTRALVIINRPMEDQYCGPCPATVHDHRRCVDETGAPTCSKRDHECATRLESAHGALEVTCGACGATHRVERLIIHLLARADNYRGTVSELYRVMRMLGEPVPMSTLYRWAEPKSTRGGSGQLSPAGYLRADNRRISVTRESDGDRPLYRVSDARKLNSQRKGKKNGR